MTNMPALGSVAMFDSATTRMRCATNRMTSEMIA